LVGCEKHAAPTETASVPSAPASILSAAPSAAGSEPPPVPTAPTFLRLPVASTNARDAFDGDPFTVVSSKGPVEAKLAQKRRIRRIRVVGTDVKSFSVSFDGATTIRGAGESADVDLEAQSLQVTASAATITEVEIYGELTVGIATAPEDLAERVKQLEGKPSAVELLKSLGLSSTVSGNVESARSFRTQLDRDSDQEAIVQIASGAHTYVVFVDDDAHGRAVVGTRDVARCAELKAQPVHAKDFSDVVITWKSCDKADPGGMVVTMERGMAETLWSFRSKQELHFGGATPKTVEMLSGVKVEERRTFDAQAFRYR
jgi:hypothetical protein